ncbi:MAG: transposase domain-containing protein [Pseudomonadota bacterium]
MTGWLTPQEIVALGCADLPSNVRGVNRLAARLGWRKQADKARLRPSGGGRPVWEYHESLLPSSAQSKGKVLSLPTAYTAEPGNADAWERFEALSKAQKTACEDRLKAVQNVDDLVKAGASVTAAVSAVALNEECSERSLYQWRDKVQGKPRQDWLALLAPAARKAREFSEIHPDAWDAILSDFLRPEAPRFSVCLRRASEQADDKGWGGFPHERSLRRRLNLEVPKAVQKIAREGRTAARILFPAQRRSVADLHAMQAVNMDGHVFDVFTRWDDGRIVRPTMVALQDLYSRKIVAWRVSDSEAKDVVRLAIGDLVTKYGVPDALTTDNSRAFASKWISGGATTRFRFKIRDEEPLGLLPSLGVELHFAIPGRGQSKPIERAFRDLCETIAKHPSLSGAYTGNAPDAKPENYGNAAVPIDQFRELVDQLIASHNAQTGRRTEMAKGRSFDETFQASYENAIVRWPSAAQRSLWLLAAEGVRCRKGSGEIHLFENRYWAPELNAIAGQKVVARFDPDHLQDGIRVYDLTDRFICDADCIADTGFYDVRAAREKARAETAYLKALKDEQTALRKLTPDQLGELYGGKRAPKEPAPEPPKIKRLATGGARPAPAPEPASDEELQKFEQAFGRGLRIITGGKDED